MVKIHNSEVFTYFYTPERLKHSILSSEDERKYVLDRDLLKSSIASQVEKGDLEAVIALKEKYGQLTDKFMSHNYRMTCNLFCKLRTSFLSSDHDSLNSEIISKTLDLWDSYFDPTRGRFSTLFYGCVPRHIFNFRKKIYKSEKIFYFSDFNSNEIEDSDGEGPVLSSLSSSQSPLEETLKIESIEGLNSLLKDSDVLSEREKTVLIYRFGLYSKKPLILEEIGRMIGVTKERARQIEISALNKLREVLI